MIDDCEFEDKNCFFCNISKNWDWMQVTLIDVATDQIVQRREVECQQSNFMDYISISW